MMIVDASAIIAILFDEAEAPDCMVALQTDVSRLISAVNYVEAGTVMAGRIKSGDRHEAIAEMLSDAAAKKRIQGPDHPDIFLQQIGRPPQGRGGHFQCLSLLESAK